MRRCAAVSLAIGLVTSTAWADEECIITAPSGSASVSVTPAGAPSFSLGLYNAAMSVHLGGTGDGLVEVSAPLAFSSVLTERSFYAGRAMDLAGGLVHVEPGARLLNATAKAARIVATLTLDEITVAELEVPCDGLAIKMSQDDPAKPPHEGRAILWGPRGKTVTLHELPDGGNRVSLGFLHPLDAPIQELEVRGQLHRVRFSQAYGWLTGWVDMHELVRIKPPKTDRLSSLFGIGSEGAPLKGYRGPALVAAGTVVYASAGGIGRWASVPKEALLEVIAEKGAAWVRLTGVQLLPGSVKALFAVAYDHLWIPAGAIRLPPAEPRANQH